MPASTEDLSPASPAELARYLSDNARGVRRPVTPVGGRTALRTGNPVQADCQRIATAPLAKVVDYPARDLTITVQSGIRVADLQQILAAEGQRLPIDVPDAGRATLGGAIATNTSGPGRYGHGSFRDYVIGVGAVDGTGRPFAAGGRVVKNVAGYDLCKLLIGSLGTLAVITEVTLKLRPLAESRRAAWIGFESAAAAEPVLDSLTTSATRPVAVELLNPAAVRDLGAEAGARFPPGEFILAMVYEGSERQTEWQVQTLFREVARLTPREVHESSGTLAASLWQALVEFQSAGDDPATFAASLPAGRITSFVDEASRLGVALQAHAGNGLAVGHLPDACVTPAGANEVIRPLRALAEEAGGSLVLWNCDDAWKSECSVFGAERASARWMRQVKASLDPHNVLSPGRLPFGEQARASG